MEPHVEEPKDVDSTEVFNPEELKSDDEKNTKTCNQARGTSGD